MDSRSLAITILGIAVVAGCVAIGKTWISERQEAKKVDQTVELSRQETERLRIFSQAVRRQPALVEQELTPD
ncbi:hypothetical protein C667_02963 [Thauera phenylacetica B4P]|uniref:Lipoprotein n=1 Tax=Thauera phenylacetica B4P TaxID=1234382 RepID=N6YWH7_9RHOO|nr:hypothetical protein [Thauera phenylacetica]ENO98631.1 hypothetical protein C667_02963 [Thauera phenylacetica B4P]